MSQAPGKSKPAGARYDEERAKHLSGTPQLAPRRRHEPALDWTFLSVRKLVRYKSDDGLLS
jgi:hypothetical protein